MHTLIEIGGGTSNSSLVTDGITKMSPAKQVPLGEGWGF